MTTNFGGKLNLANYYPTAKYKLRQYYFHIIIIQYLRRLSLIKTSFVRRSFSESIGGADLTSFLIFDSKSASSHLNSSLQGICKANHLAVNLQNTDNENRLLYKSECLLSV